MDDEILIDFLSFIAIPLPEGVTWVLGPNGLDSEPALRFLPNSKAFQLTKNVLPLSFPSDFAITATVLSPTNGGVLFAVTNEDNSKIYLGLEILPVQAAGPDNNGSMIIRFMFLNPYFGRNETINFPVKEFANKWTKFALSKQDNLITLHFSCGSEVFEKVATQVWGAFIIPDTSLFHLGRVGNNIKYNVFEVV